MRAATWWARRGAGTRPVWAWLLVLALLHAQALGHWHRVQHAPGALLHAASDHGAAFGHGAGDDAQCRLYDALGTAAGLVPSVAAVEPAPAPVAAVPARDDAAVGSPTPRRYHARGPPAA